MTTATTPEAPPTTLAPGQLACAGCGVAVDGPHERVERLPLNVFSRDGKLIDQHMLTLTRCATCRDRRERAEALASAFPRIVARIGAPDLAVQYIDGVLACGDLVGAPVAWPTELHGATSSITNGRDLSLLLGQASAQGMGLSFARLADGGACNARPWDHITPAQRTDVRDALARWFKAKIEEPRAYAPPADADRPGCLFCGRASVMAMPSRQHEAWVPIDVDSRALGGQPGTRVWGYVCAPCRDAIDTANAGIGQSALAAAVLAHIDARVAPGQVSMTIPAWAVTGRGPQKPWAHVDLDALRHDLASAGGMTLTTPRRRA